MSAVKNVVRICCKIYQLLKCKYNSANIYCTQPFADGHRGGFPDPLKNCASAFLVKIDVFFLKKKNAFTSSKLVEIFSICFCFFDRRRIVQIFFIDKNTQLKKYLGLADPVCLSCRSFLRWLSPRRVKIQVEHLCQERVKIGDLVAKSIR